MDKSDLTFISIVIFLILTVSYSAVSLRFDQEERHPIILIPGDGGNQMEAKVNLEHSPSFFCTKHSNDFFLLWANVKYFFPYIINCFVNMMRLVRDPATGMTHNSPGVEIRIPGWGQTYAVEWLSSLKVGPLSYYNKLVNDLVETREYQRDIDVRGAPYDFRKAPNEMGQYFTDLKELIESTYSSNGDRSVVLIAHSLGGPLTLHFLQRQSQAWKDQYIKSLVSIGGAYGGSAMSVETMASGNSFGIPTVSPLTVRLHQRTLPSTPYLLPKAPAWTANQVIAMTDQRNYTINDYDAFYRDMGYPQAIPLTNDVINLTDPRVGPGVEVHCIMTRHTKTDDVFDWRGLSWPDSKPRATQGEGDGTVNWRSLALCPQFASSQSQPVHSHMIENTDHLGVLRDSRLGQYILQNVL